jgi:hypothetical protein
MSLDVLTIKLMSLAVHAEEYLETLNQFDAETIRSLLSDPEIKALREKMDGLALLPVKRNER